MTANKNERWIWALSVFFIAAVIVAGYWYVRWGYLHAQVALGEEQTQMFEECRIQANQSNDPKRIADLIEAVIIYYPSGSKQTVGSHLDKMVERSRQATLKDIITHLRTTTGVDLGNDPQVWIQRFGDKNTVQPKDRENTRANSTETNFTSPK